MTTQNYTCIDDCDLLKQCSSLRVYAIQVKNKYTKDMNELKSKYTAIIEQYEKENASLKERLVRSGKTACCVPKCTPCPIHDIPLLDGSMKRNNGEVVVEVETKGDEEIIEDLLEDLELEEVTEVENDVGNNPDDEEEMKTVGETLEKKESSPVHPKLKKATKTSTTPTKTAITDWLTASIEELESWTVSDLKQMCKTHKMRGYSKITSKDALIKFVVEHRHTAVHKKPAGSMALADAFINN